MHAISNGHCHVFPWQASAQLMTRLWRCTYVRTCSNASDGQLLFRVPGQDALIDGPAVIKMLRLKVRVGVQV